MIFLNILGVILCSFRLVLEGKTGKQIPQSSRLEFLEKFSAKNFALSDAEDNTSAPTITSLPEPYFRFKRFILLVQIIDFYELWQQHKQLKATEMSEALSDIYNEGYIHQFQPEPTHKIH